MVVHGRLGPVAVRGRCDSTLAVAAERLRLCSSVASRPTGALCGGRWGVVPGRGALRCWDGGRLGGGAGRGAGMADVLAG